MKKADITVYQKRNKNEVKDRKVRNFNLGTGN